MSSASEDSSIRTKLLQAIESLEQIVENRRVLSELDTEERRRLLVACGMVGTPDKRSLRDLRKELRKKTVEQAKNSDRKMLERTGIRALRAQPVFPSLPYPKDFIKLTGTMDTTQIPGDAGSEPEAPLTLIEARKCYICKLEFREVHSFYDQMCEPCAEMNFARRNESADLRGKVALVTGARVKIGYQTALKLLRAGAHTIVVTRFPRDAARRYANELDFESFRDRLQIYGVDLRHTPSVEALCTQLNDTLPRLDYILNNACQTVRRPAGFYQHLLEGERTEPSPEALSLLKSHPMDLSRERSRDSVSLSQAKLLPEDGDFDVRIFPLNKLDQDEQQIDLRRINSWRLKLAEVSSVELLEVQLVNAVAPFVLNAKLKPLMDKTPGDGKHIVNVSAMEGQFYRAFKTDKHPHTNMAKAALNMMTRTSASDYLQSGICMNSVDTGWVTDEDPAHIAARKTEEHGFHPPLDIIDGAARIVHPIWESANRQNHLWGLFLKDYKSIPW